MSPRHLLASLALFCLVAISWDPARAAAALEVGLAATDITPDVAGKQPVWMAGQEINRRAEGVHDALNARALVLRAGTTKFALVAVDVIGVQLPTVDAIRAQLPDFNYVLVASTHNHEGPDVVGIWGPSPGETGVDPGYLEHLVAGVVAAVKQADQSAVPAKAFYGTAAEPKLLKDFRLPEVYDPVLRAVRFVREDDGRECGLLVQWNSHPVEPNGNHQITRDFMGYTVDELAKRHDCPVIYFSGAVGGLMGTPSEPLLSQHRGEIKNYFDFMRVYGHAVADLCDKAMEQAEPLELTPLLVARRRLAVRLDNPGYRQARKAGVLSRSAVRWTGDADQLGEPLSKDQLDGEQASESEVACLRLGTLDVAAIPGELYPELVYGEVPERAEPEADFADAPLEPTVAQTIGNSRLLLIGLANDEVGYIVPKRQWDVAAPFAYGRTSAQYGERNSMGPETARILLEGLERCVRELPRR